MEPTTPEEVERDREATSNLEEIFGIPARGRGTSHSPELSSSQIFRTSNINIRAIRQDEDLRRNLRAAGLI